MLYVNQPKVEKFIKRKLSLIDNENEETHRIVIDLDKEHDKYMANLEINCFDTRQL